MSADFAQRSAEQALASVAGSCPTVRPGGYLQGGGLGPLSRKYGVACDRLVSADVVLANGRVVRCDAQCEPDLFWALRGGGGDNFGVVTRFEVRPVAITRLPAYSLVWPWAAAPQVVAAFQQWLAAAPDDLDANLTVMQPGPAPVVLVAGSWLGGDPAGLVPHLDALVSAVGSAPVNRNVLDQSYRDAVMRTYGCADRTPEQCQRVGDNPDAQLAQHPYSSGRGRMIGRPLTSAAIDELLTAFAAPAPQGAFRVLSVGGLGGQINRLSRSETAFVHRTSLVIATFTASMPGFTPTPDEQAGVAEWTGGGLAVLNRHGNGESYVNTMDAQLGDWRAAYYGENYARLTRVKRRYDPYRFFRFPQAVGA